MKLDELFDFSEITLEKARKVKFVLTDVDGVLTKGDINYSSSGEEFKSFNAKDGLGIKLLLKSDFKVGIITGRNSEITSYRSEELGITECYQGIKDKVIIFNQLLEKYTLKPEEVAYIGDDWNDLSVLNKVGLSVCPADAHVALRSQTDYTTNAKGGEGALREMVDLILVATGHWTRLFNDFNQC